MGVHTATKRPPSDAPRKNTCSHCGAPNALVAVPRTVFAPSRLFCFYVEVYHCIVCGWSLGRVR